MFAEDVDLLPKGSFLNLLQTHREQPVTLQQMLRVRRRQEWAKSNHTTGNPLAPPSERR